MNNLKQKFDASTVAVLRQALNEVVTDQRFMARKTVTPLEVAEHILEQAAFGERDLNRLKNSAFEKLGAAAWGDTGGVLPRRHSDAKAAEVSLGGLLRGVKALRVRIDPEIVEQRSQLVMQHAKLMRVQEIFTSPR